MQKMKWLAWTILPLAALFLMACPPAEEPAPEPATDSRILDLRPSPRRAPRWPTRPAAPCPAAPRSAQSDARSGSGASAAPFASSDIQTRYQLVSLSPWHSSQFTDERAFNLRRALYSGPFQASLKEPSRTLATRSEGANSLQQGKTSPLKLTLTDCQSWWHCLG